ncbi:MAG: DUF393 domain-containing protein [Rhodospirillales bacterium]|nr:DUF393 domain-containing protein [Rhodospirillales bacterium]
MNPPLVMLFDGVCYLCRDSVQFVLRRDPDAKVDFAPLQSDYGRDVLRRHGLPEGSLQSVVLVQDGEVYTKSTAALRIARELSGGWPLLYLFMVVPRFLRDGVYDFIGNRRYRWFGKMDACWIPDQDVSNRFLG